MKEEEGIEEWEMRRCVERDKSDQSEKRRKVGYGEKGF